MGRIKCSKIILIAPNNSRYLLTIEFINKIRCSRHPSSCRSMECRPALVNRGLFPKTVRLMNSNDFGTEQEVTIITIVRTKHIFPSHPRLTLSMRPTVSIKTLLPTIKRREQRNLLRSKQSWKNEGFRTMTAT